MCERAGGRVIKGGGIQDVEFNDRSSVDRNAAVGVAQASITERDIYSSGMSLREVFNAANLPGPAEVGHPGR